MSVGVGSRFELTFEIERREAVGVLVACSFGTGNGA